MDAEYFEVKKDVTTVKDFREFLERFGAVDSDLLWAYEGEVIGIHIERYGADGKLEKGAFIWAYPTSDKK